MVNNHLRKLAEVKKEKHIGIEKRDRSRAQLRVSKHGCCHSRAMQSESLVLFRIEWSDELLVEPASTVPYSTLGRDKQRRSASSGPCHATDLDDLNPDPDPSLGSDVEAKG